MHRGHALFAVAAAGLVASACGSSSSSSISSPASAPSTTNVQIDGKADAFNSEFIAYFPQEVKVHAGDTVNFTSVFRGAPHSVVLGKLVQTGLDAYDQKVAAAGGPQSAQNVEDHSIPELAAIPDMIPDPRHATPGTPRDANQVTAQPCYLESGDPPTTPAAPCPKTAQPDFSGGQSFYSSGYLADGEQFAVKLSSSLAPGTYRYMCALHRTGMTGKITVVDGGTTLPSAADVKKQGDDELQKRVASIQPAVDQANQGDPAKPFAGVGTPTARGTEASIFAPKTASIPVGGSVTWTVIGFHTISFNAPQDASPVLVRAPDGSVHVNPKTVAPQGGSRGIPLASSPPSPSAGASPSASAAPASPSATASGAPQLPPPTVHDLGKVPASGFWSTGLIVSFPDPSNPASFSAVKLTFPTAGTYQYKCLIHVDMEGTVKVGQSS